MTTVNESPELTEFFCCAERHFAQFHAPPPKNRMQVEPTELTLVGGAAGLIYSFLLRLSVKHERQVWVAIPKVAAHLKIHLRTAERAFEHLHKSGFFVLLESGKAKGEASLYKILVHSEWAEKYPEQCSQKFDAGWKDEEDPLGVALYAACAGKIKFSSFHIACYRRLQGSCTPPLSDQMVMDQFRVWFPPYAAAQKGKHWRKSVGRKFKEHLEKLVGRLSINGIPKTPLPLGDLGATAKSVCH